MKDMETSKYKYVLAMYDVRGKQNFIYRSTHIKEIIGGSDIIRTIFQRELYSAAKEYRNTINSQVDKEAEAIYDYPRPNANMNTIEEVKFSFDMFMNRMSDPQYIGEIVYDGPTDQVTQEILDEIYNGTAIPTAEK